MPSPRFPRAPSPPDDALAEEQRQQIRRIDQQAVAAGLSPRRWASLLHIITWGGYAEHSRFHRKRLEKAQKLAADIERSLLEDHAKMHALFARSDRPTRCEPLGGCPDDPLLLFDTELVKLHADVCRRFRVAAEALTMMLKVPWSALSLVFNTPIVEPGDEYGATLYWIKQELKIEPTPLALRTLAFGGDSLPIDSQKIRRVATKYRTAAHAYDKERPKAKLRPPREEPPGRRQRLWRGADADAAARELLTRLVAANEHRAASKSTLESAHRRPRHTTKR